MKIKIPKFMRNMTDRYLSKSLSEELGFDVCIKLNALQVDTKGLNYRVHLDVDAEIDKKGVKTYVKSNLKKKGS